METIMLALNVAFFAFNVWALLRINKLVKSWGYKNIFDFMTK